MTSLPVSHVNSTCCCCLCTSQTWNYTNLINTQIYENTAFTIFLTWSMLCEAVIFSLLPYNTNKLRVLWHLLFTPFLDHLFDLFDLMMSVSLNSDERRAEINVCRYTVNQNASQCIKEKTNSTTTSWQLCFHPVRNYSNPKCIHLTRTFFDRPDYSPFLYIS